MPSPRVAQLAAEIHAALVGVEGVRAVYLFGTARESETPNDIDVLVVYGPPLEPLAAPNIRAPIEQAVSRVFSKPTHLMVFSEREAREPGLVSGLEPILVYGHPVA